MRRVALLAFVLLVSSACRQERRAAEPHPPAGAQTATRSSSAPAPLPPPVAPKPTVRSTPQHCAGDGSYMQAVDCLRIASSLRFTIDDGSGSLTRPTPGNERLELRIGKGADRGDWVAAAAAAGIVWTRDGKRTAAVPQRLEALYQRLTIFPDPQKREGEPRLVSKDATALTYAFTDANSGTAYTIRVSAGDGHIEKMQIGGMSISFSG